VSIEEIVAACLKDIKKLKTPCTIKMVTQLTAVAEYVVHCKYVICKRPCLNASLVVARCMAKGPLLGIWFSITQITFHILLLHFILLLKTFFIISRQ
jgi:hypothetical protein